MSDKPIQPQVTVKVSLEHPGIIDVSGEATTHFAQRIVLEQVVGEICSAARADDSVALGEWEDVFLRAAALCKEAKARVS